MQVAPAGSRLERLQIRARDLATEVSGPNRAADPQPLETDIARRGGFHRQPRHIARRLRGDDLAVDSKTVRPGGGDQILEKCADGKHQLAVSGIHLRQPSRGVGPDPESPIVNAYRPRLCIVAAWRERSVVQQSVELRRNHVVGLQVPDGGPARLALHGGTIPLSRGGGKRSTMRRLARQTARGTLDPALGRHTPEPFTSQGGTRMARSFVSRGLAVLVAVSAIVFGCAKKEESNATSAAGTQASTESKGWTGDFDGMLERRDIRVLVPYSRSLYFVENGKEHGLTAELAHDFETYLNSKHSAELGGRPIKVTLVPTTRDRLLPELVDGKGDIAGGNLTATPSRMQTADFVAPTEQAPANEVLVSGPGDRKSVV